MQAWVPFYSVIATAAAALLGLLFVAVSVTAREDFSRPHSPTRALAEQAFQNYLAVLVISCIALFPDDNTAAIGGACLAVVGFKSLWALWRLVQTVRHGSGEMPLFITLRRHAISIAGFSLLVLATWRMASGHRDSFHTLASGLLMLLGSSATVSWDLLHHLLRHPRKEDDNKQEG
ncbi:hypothetical protein [Novosphingobium sp.]|uniref:hypothetical protein n=1 Tax=Novosphingobium sp. TaxID=1874826 RepID=UPI0031D07957